MLSNVTYLFKGVKNIAYTGCLKFILFNLHMNKNNILSSVSHETHSNKLKASPCTSFSDPRGHFPHKKPKINIIMQLKSS